MNQLATIPTTSLDDMRTMAENIAASQMFGLKTPEQAMTLMLLCQAEGLHPVSALRRYHLIEGRPAMRADAMQGEFQAKGGGIIWHVRTDEMVSATFFAEKDLIDDSSRKRAQERFEALWQLESEDDANKRPKLMSVVAKLSRDGEETVIRTYADAQVKGLTSGRDGTKKNWSQSPRQMLTARVITEGVRVIMPGLIAGIYTPDEIEDAVEIERTEKQERIEAADEQLDRAKQIASAGCQSKEDQDFLRTVIAQLRERSLKLTGTLRDSLLGIAGDLQAAADDYREEQAAESVNAEVEKRAQSRGETNEVHADNWQSVVCHVGKSGGPIKGKTMGEICGPEVKTTRAQKLLEWLETNWLAEAAPKIEALGPRANMDDRRLALALGFARTAFDARIKAETPPKAEKPEIQPPSATEEASEPDLTAPLPEKSAKPKRQQIQWREAVFPYEAKIKGTKLGELMPVAETLGISPVKAFQLIAKQFLLDPERTKGADPKLDKQFRACYAAGEADLCLGEPKSTIVKHLLELSSDLALSQDFMCQSCEECGLFHAPETRSNPDRRFADYTEDELRLVIYRWPEAETTFKWDFARAGK